jgi:hypothetical protein
VGPVSHLEYPHLPPTLRTFETGDPGDEQMRTFRTGEPYSSEERALDISAVQCQAWGNKLAKGFNLTDVALEFGLLTAEVSEALQPGGNGCPTSAKNWQTFSSTWLAWPR